VGVVGWARIEFFWRAIDSVPSSPSLHPSLPQALASYEPNLSIKNTGVEPIIAVGTGNTAL
jgi:hypothetical protein